MARTERRKSLAAFKKRPAETSRILRELGGAGFPV